MPVACLTLPVYDERIPQCTGHTDDMPHTHTPAPLPLPQTAQHVAEVATNTDSVAPIDKPDRQVCYLVLHALLSSSTAMPDRTLKQSTHSNQYATGLSWHP